MSPSMKPHIYRYRGDWRVSYYERGVSGRTHRLAESFAGAAEFVRFLNTRREVI